jgi:hypothetical protein
MLGATGFRVLGMLPKDGISEYLRLLSIMWICGVLLIRTILSCFLAVAPYLIEKV